LHHFYRHFFFFAICMLCENSFAQTPAYKHYDVSNGLPTNEVYEIKQDSKGFLWIGCDAGLVRYDGNRFKLLSNKKNRGPAISGLREINQAVSGVSISAARYFLPAAIHYSYLSPGKKIITKVLLMLLLMKTTG
jgi:hypothetical protein